MLTSWVPNLINFEENHISSSRPQDRILSRKMSSKKWDSRIAEMSAYSYFAPGRLRGVTQLLYKWNFWTATRNCHGDTYVGVSRGRRVRIWPTFRSIRSCFGATVDSLKSVIISMLEFWPPLRDEWDQWKIRNGSTYDWTIPDPSLIRFWAMVSKLPIPDPSLIRFGAMVSKLGGLKDQIGQRMTSETPGLSLITRKPSPAPGAVREFLLANRAKFWNEKRKYWVLRKMSIQLIRIWSRCFFGTCS